MKAEDRKQPSRTYIWRLEHCPPIDGSQKTDWTDEKVKQYAHELAARELEMMAQLTDNYSVDSDGKTSAARLRARAAELRKASQ